jgi:hypothetical protein
MIAFKHTEVKKKVVGVGFGIKSLFLTMDNVSQGKESLCVRKGNQPKIKDKDLAPEVFCIRRSHARERAFALRLKMRSLTS